MEGRFPSTSILVAVIVACFPISARSQSGPPTVPAVLGSIDALRVKVGDEFKRAGQRLVNCRSSDFAGTKRIGCRTPLKVGGLKFYSVTYESRGGASVDTVTANGNMPRSCSNALAAFAETLGPSWMVQPFETIARGGQKLTAIIEGDLRLTVSCADFLGLTLSVQDEWLSLSVGNRLDPPEMPQPAPELSLAQATALARYPGVSLWPLGVGEVVWSVVENYGNAVESVRVPKSRWSDLATRYAWPEIESALSSARSSTSTLSPRSAKAFEDYATLVASDGWFAGECMKVWGKK